MYSSIASVVASLHNIRGIAMNAKAKPEQVVPPYHLTVNNEKVIGGGFKYDNHWFAMARVEDCCK